ncbi:MAG: hypothetical protein NC431_06140 [Firmicutes bacterium]|nr:hypothetical protein [Bacillota bacterium]
MRKSRVLVSVLRYVMNGDHIQHVIKDHGLAAAIYVEKLQNPLCSKVTLSAKYITVINED